MSAPAYRRGQVEWALEQNFLQENSVRSPPAAFRTRVKRLLEIDREQSEPEFWAFSDSSTAGSGVEATFSAFDAFCLALALDLLSVGFKQAETVFFVSHLRQTLRREFDRIIKNYPELGFQLAAAKDYPFLPSRRVGKTEVADTDVFFVIPSIEIDAAAPRNSKHKARLRPLVCCGHDELNKAFLGAPALTRCMLVLEIAARTRRLPRLLEAAPAVTRGRKS